MFEIHSENALEGIQAALRYLFEESVKRKNDKFASDFDYEELAGVLLNAEAALKEAEELKERIAELEEEADDS